MGRAEADVINILEYENGETPDTDFIPLPGWKRLRNLWVNSSGKIGSRPHYTPTSTLRSNIQGVLFNNANQLMYVADNTLYSSVEAETLISGGLFPRFDVHRTYTVITTGGKPILFQDGGSFSELPHENVKCLGTFQGAQKLRMVFCKSDDLNTLHFTTIGDLTDTGTVIVDPRGIADDEWTEGLTIRNLPFDIVDMQDLNNQIMLFTTRGIYSISDPDRIFEETGFIPELRKRINIEIVDTRTRKDEGQVWFLSPDGVKRLFFEEGFPTFSSLNMEGIEKTILNAPITSQSQINVDKIRKLVFLTLDTSSNVTYVFNMRGELWTSWDGMIQDSVSVAGTTYVTLAGQGYVYKLDDTGIGDSDFIDVEFRTGLGPIPVDKVALRKRLRYLHTQYHKTGDLYFYIESVADEIITDVSPVWVKADNSTRVVHYLGDQGELFSLSINFRTNRSVVFDEFLLDLLFKPTRLLG